MLTTVMLSGYCDNTHYHDSLGPEEGGSIRSAPKNIFIIPSNLLAVSAIYRCCAIS